MVRTPPRAPSFSRVLEGIDMARNDTSNKGKRRRLSVVHPNAAGIDIGSRFHVAAVPEDRDGEVVRSYGTFTGDLIQMAEWLQANGVRTVAMESTGVYWIPAFEILEERGFEVILVNAREAKNVPGRKTDINDAQWLQRLHSFGLLRASFRPAQKIATLRAYLRQRERLLDYAASHIQHMQKALMEMNLQLHHVVTDITGKTGMRILRAIVDGEHDPKVLAEYRDPRCKATKETIEAALTGHYREEHLLALEQAISLYDTYHCHVESCDQAIEAHFAELGQARPSSSSGLPKARHRDANRNAPSFDVRSALYAVTGVDLTQIHGLGPYLALKLIGECGTDMKRWPSAKHFTSWLGLAPGCKISGGKVLSARTKRSSSRAAALLRLAATTLSRTSTALGAFYRRLASRIGKAKAVTATARKIAVLFYGTLREGQVYRDPGADYYEQRYRQRVIVNLQRRASTMGFDLVPSDTVAPA